VWNNNVNASDTTTIAYSLLSNPSTCTKSGKQRAKTLNRENAPRKRIQNQKGGKTSGSDKAKLTEVSQGQNDALHKSAKQQAKLGRSGDQTLCEGVLL